MTEQKFSEAHGTFFQAIQENRFLYSDHNEIKLEINSKKNYTNLWKVNKTPLNGKKKIEEIKRHQSNFQNRMKIKTQYIKIYKIL